MIVAAAVSELNRALTEVTDGEEWRVLSELLDRKTSSSAPE
jgi:hypothetical protein